MGVRLTPLYGMRRETATAIQWSRVLFAILLSDQIEGMESVYSKYQKLARLCFEYESELACIVVLAVFVVQYRCL